MVKINKNLSPWKNGFFLVWGIGRVLHVLGERRRLLNYASLLKVSFLLNHQQLTKIFFGPIIIAIGACQRNLGCFILIYFYIEQYYLLFRFPTGLLRSMNLEICVASSLSKWEMMQVILHGLTLNKRRKISREDVLFIAKRIQVVILNSQWEMWENDLMKDLVISAFVVIQRLAIIH